MASAVGYGSASENVPEEFLNSGLITLDFEEEYQEYYAKLRTGEATTITVPCKVADGSFHWIRIDSKVIFDRDGMPYQTVMSFKDVEQEREQATSTGAQGSMQAALSTLTIWMNTRGF